MDFEPDKYYKHHSGDYLYVCAPVIQTHLWGRTLIGEICRGDQFIELRPLSNDKMATANWRRITKEEYMENCRGENNV